MQKDNFDIHIRDFLLFRRSTDEIDVITGEISRVIFKKVINNFLDIGTGSGELTEALIKKFGIKNTIAIDKHILNKKFNKNIIFLKKDWLSFAYHQKFDLILSAHSMAYLSFRQAEKAIKKIHDYLEEGGCAVIIIYDNQGNWPAFKRVFYPKKKLEKCTLDYIRPIISKYNFKEKSFFTKIHAKSLNQMMEIGRFLAEKHLSLYLSKAKEVSAFFRKFRKNKKIVFFLKHRIFILYKQQTKDLKQV